MAAAAISASVFGVDWQSNDNFVGDAKHALDTPHGQFRGMLLRIALNMTCERRHAICRGNTNMAGNHAWLPV